MIREKEDSKDVVPTNLPVIDKEYEKNNNESANLLKNVRFNSFTRTESILFATSGSTMALILLIAITILTFRCIIMCKTSNQNADNRIFAMLENECQAHKNLCRDVLKNEENSSLNADDVNEQKLEADKSSFECEVKKQKCIPAFQQKRQ